MTSTRRLPVRAASSGEDERLCSVIVPLFNKAPYVRSSLESACEQTHRALEIIVVDDGSTDRSVQEAGHIGDPRIRIISQRNAGVSEARNRGVALARGEFLFFLDADDIWHPQFVEAALRAFDAYPDVALVGADLTTIPTTHAADDGFPPYADVTVQRVDDMAAFWLAEGHQRFCTSSTAVRAQVRQSADSMFPRGLSNGEDLHVWFRINCDAPIALIRQSMVLVRTETANSLSAANAAGFAVPIHVAMMERRVLARSVRPPLIESWRRFVARDHLDRALRMVEAGRLAQAFRVVMARWTDAVFPRWWGVLALVLLPASLRRALRGRWAARRASGEPD